MLKNAVEDAEPKCEMRRRDWKKRWKSGKDQEIYFRKMEWRCNLFFLIFSNFLFPSAAYFLNDPLPINLKETDKNTHVLEKKLLIIQIKLQNKSH